MLLEKRVRIIAGIVILLIFSLGTLLYAEEVKIRLNVPTVWT